jgi:hypothetical protein
MNRSTRSILVLLVTGGLTVGCSHPPKPAPIVQPPRPMVPVPPPPPPATVVAEPTPTPSTPSILVKEAGLQTPECVLWDAEQDVYFVSNINGDPTVADLNGFISKISPDGKVAALKWIDGSVKTTELNAPKGMAIIGKELYIADLNTVRKFDRKTGKSKGKIDIKDSSFLNALTVSPDGKTLYVSDSAIKIENGNFTGLGNDAIYAIDVKKKSVKPLIKDKALNWPNGILADEGGLWVVTLGKNELIRVNYKGEIGSVFNLPKGALDGILKLKDSSLLITSWQGSAIYRGLPGGEFKELFSGVTSPAAIGLDVKRQAVLVPGFMNSTVEVHLLPILPLLDTPTPASSAPAAKPAAPSPAPTPAPSPAPTPIPAPAEEHRPARWN